MNCRGIKTNMDNTFATGMYYQDKLYSCEAFDCFISYWNSPDFKSRMKQFENRSSSLFNKLVGMSETWKERYKIAENPNLKEFNNVIRRYKNKELPDCFMEYITTLVKIELLTRKFKSNKLKEKFVNKKIYHTYMEYLNIDI